MARRKRIRKALPGFAVLSGLILYPWQACGTPNFVKFLSRCSVEVENVSCLSAGHTVRLAAKKQRPGRSRGVAVQPAPAFFHNAEDRKPTYAPVCGRTHMFPPPQHLLPSLSDAMAHLPSAQHAILPLESLDIMGQAFLPSFP